MTDKEMQDLVAEMFDRLHQESVADAMSIFALLGVMIYKAIESEKYDKTIEQFADHLHTTIIEGYHDNSVGLMQ
jgi:hypothetical protein